MKKLLLFWFVLFFAGHAALTFAHELAHVHACRYLDVNAKPTVSFGLTGAETDCHSAFSVFEPEKYALLHGLIDAVGYPLSILWSLVCACFMANSVIARRGKNA